MLKSHNQAVLLPESNDQVFVEGKRNVLLIIIPASNRRLELSLRENQARSWYRQLAGEVPGKNHCSLIDKVIEKLDEADKEKVMAFVSSQK